MDVTLKLVDAFLPNERQRKSAIEIQKHKPISLEQAEKIKGYISNTPNLGLITTPLTSAA